MVPMDVWKNPHGFPPPRRRVAAPGVGVLGAPHGAKGATAQHRGLGEVHEPWPSGKIPIYI